MSFSTVTHLQPGYQASGSDSGNGSGDSEFEASTTTVTSIKGVVIQRYENGAERDDLSVEDQLVVATPSMIIHSMFDFEGFATLLLPTGPHLPLDPTALRGVSGMLLDSAPRVIASHLSRIDLDLALSPGRGLELAILPHGRQARLDLIG